LYDADAIDIDDVIGVFFANSQKYHYYILESEKIADVAAYSFLLFFNQNIEDISNYFCRIGKYVYFLKYMSHCIIIGIEVKNILLYI